MNTKTITLRAIDLIPGLGNDKDGIPFRWLMSLVQKVQAAVPDEEEATCRVHNVAGLTFTYEHVLSDVEKLQETRDALLARAEQIKALLPREGALTAEQTDQLRRLLG